MSVMQPARAIGDFAVTVDAASAAALAGALGREPADGPVPMTYPMRWLAAGQVRNAILAAARAESEATGLLAIHVEQRIALSAPLRLGARYLLSLSVEGPDASGRLRVSGVFTDSDGAEAGRLTSGLLLVPAPGGDAP